MSIFDAKNIEDWQIGFEDGLKFSTKFFMKDVQRIANFDDLSKMAIDFLKDEYKKKHKFEVKSES